MKINFITKSEHQWLLRFHVLFVCIIVFLVSIGIWASVATMDEITSGQGRVIPSGRVQVVQNLEGGIVSEILIHEGDAVAKDQVLIRIDDTRFASSFRESKSYYLASCAKIVRLTSESKDTPFKLIPLTSLHTFTNFDKNKYNEYKPQDVSMFDELLKNEQQLYNLHQEALETAIRIFNKQLEQKRADIIQNNEHLKHLQTTYDLANKELKLSEPLETQGVVSAVEMLRLKRNVNELQTQIDATRLTIPKINASIDEIKKKIEECRIQFRSQALAELNKEKAQLSSMSEAITALEDRVTRTEVRAPVKGTIKQVRVTTIGGVVQPGMDLVEIVPLEDNLLVEAVIKPSDIAFLRYGMTAQVVFTAYDFSLYGGLKGTLTHISADSINTTSGDSFYKIRVKTEKTYLGNELNPFPIMPGMVAKVDIITGKKTILAYLLKPLLKISNNAFKER